MASRSRESRPGSEAPGRRGASAGSPRRGAQEGARGAGPPRWRTARAPRDPSCRRSASGPRPSVAWASASAARRSRSVFPAVPPRPGRQRQAGIGPRPAGRGGRRTAEPTSALRMRDRSRPSTMRAAEAGGAGASGLQSRVRRSSTLRGSVAAPAALGARTAAPPPSSAWRRVSRRPGGSGTGARSPDPLPGRSTAGAGRTGKDGAQEPRWPRRTLARPAPRGRPPSPAIVSWNETLKCTFRHAASRWVPEGPGCERGRGPMSDNGDPYAGRGRGSDGCTPDLRSPRAP